MIEPALTFAEWAQSEQLRDAYEGSDEWYRYIGGMKPHASAAIALHGQTFGFTHEDVAALRRACDDAERWNAARSWNDGHDALDRARTVADRIEALLPPEGT